MNKKVLDISLILCKYICQDTCKHKVVEITDTNVLIVGSGIAAFQLAKQLSSHRNVMIITKSGLKQSNSYLAQGGIAGALSQKDSPRKHMADTLAAGEYHNDESIVQELTNKAPLLLQELIQSGCPFDRDESGELLFGMEGAHSEKRIIHSGGDATGEEVIDFFHGNIGHNIEIKENIFVFELVIDQKSKRCIGVKGKSSDGTIHTFYAEHIVLATGGCGQLYQYTSNDEHVTGDGIALAYRAGAQISDMEFIQFHPTLLYKDGKTRGLVSEAVRGEGARLVTGSGRYLMDGVHSLADLAPRHIVAQTIFNALEEGEEIYLDISTVRHFNQRFPTIAKLCEENSIDVNKQLLPVVPGAHFLMGGIKTDAIGRTNITSLYAIGEVARTGIHGANRLASNSLLEGLFMGKGLAEYIKKQAPMEWDIPVQSEQKSHRLRLPDIQTIKQMMMQKAGIVRTEAELLELKTWLESFQIEQLIQMNLNQVSNQNITKISMLTTAWLITKSALERTESRGGHFRLDYPISVDEKWCKKEIIHSIHEREIQTDEYLEVTTTA